MGDAVSGLAGKRSAVMLANHGPVVAGRDVGGSCNAVEELEDSARLALMLRSTNANALNDEQVCDVVMKLDVDWDD